MLSHIIAGTLAMVAVAQPAQKQGITREHVLSAVRTLETDPVLVGYQIAVRIEEGKAVLAGTVPSKEIRERADKVVARVIDPKYIVNKIELSDKATPEVRKNSPPTQSDAEQRAELKRVIESLKPSISEGLKYEIQVKPIPSIVVEGLVDTYQDKLEISRVIRAHYVGLPVLNNAVVRDRSTMPLSPPKATVKTKTQVIDKNVTVDDENLPETAALAEDIKQKILMDKRINAATIIVNVNADVATLSGTVGSRAEEVIALRIALETPGIYDVFDDLRIEGKVGKGPRKEVVVNAKESVVYFRRVIARRLPHLDRAEVSVDDEGVVNIVISDVHLTGPQLESIADYLRSIADEIGANTKVTIL